MRKKLFIGIILVASIAGLLIYNLAKSNEILPVALAEAREGALSESVYALGTLTAAQEEDVLVPFSGMAERVLVKPGDRVKQGQLLFVMDGTALEDQVKLEENNLAMLAIEERMYRNGRVELAKQALAEGREPEDVFDENELEMYRLRKERSLLALESLREDLANREVRAGMDGIVAAVAVKQGAAAAEGTVAVSLLDDRQLVAKAYLNELDFGKVREGMAAVITGDFFEEEVAGTVSFVSPIAAPADPASRDPAVEIHVSLEDVPELLKPGLSVALEIILPEERHVLVPLSAVRFSGEGTFVYEVADGRAVQKQVVAGRDDGTDIEILDGLSAGDRIIERLVGDIADGVRVSIDD